MHMENPMENPIANPMTNPMAKLSHGPNQKNGAEFPPEISTGSRVSPGNRAATPTAKALSLPEIRGTSDGTRKRPWLPVTFNRYQNRRNMRKY